MAAQLSQDPRLMKKQVDIEGINRLLLKKKGFFEPKGMAQNNKVMKLTARDRTSYERLKNQFHLEPHQLAKSQSLGFYATNGVPGMIRSKKVSNNNYTQADTTVPDKTPAVAS